MSQYTEHFQGPVVQSFDSLMSLLITNLSTVVAQVFFKYIDIFAAKIATHIFFSKNYESICHISRKKPTDLDLDCLQRQGILKKPTDQDPHCLSLSM